MTTITEALEIVKANIEAINKTETKNLNNCLEAVLAEDVISTINMPPFRQSAMDGYAVNLHDDNTYKIIDEVKAGDGHNPELKQGEATRIFTGAPVPDSANAIIIQENVTIKDSVLITNKPINIDANIRPLGEQTKIGDIALTKGTKLTAAGIGFLASLGFTEAKVYKSLEIAIVVTGNELAKAGEPLQYGQVYESNAIMLTTALKSLGFTNTTTVSVDDDYQNTYNTLKDTLSNHDLVLVSGGISVGDYDFVGKALLELGTEQLFYKVKQKPGKPLFFGKNNNTYVFALPGNPASALSCFYVYVNVAIQQLSGNKAFELKWAKAKSTSTFTKKGDRPQFLKAVYNNGQVEILEGQNSSMIHTFALANALVYGKQEFTHTIEKGDELDLLLLPTHI